MTAWLVSSTWNGRLRYGEYRASVQRRAREFERRIEDCADISMILLLDFAAWHHLPVALQDNNGNEYASWSNNFSDWRPYYDRVKRRIGAAALFNRNTEVNLQGPQPGDLLLRRDHAAIVFAIYGPGMSHPLAENRTIPDFPGADQAARQLATTRYMRSRSSNGIRFDYLNHRGHGKDQAELIFNAEIPEMQQQGFQFRQYTSDVLRDPPPASSSGGCNVGLIGR